MNIDEVTRLDGWLQGISALNGDIRDYSAFSYIIDLKEVRNNSIEIALKMKYQPQIDLKLSKIEKLECGLKDLEQEIEHYLIREFTYVSSDRLSDLRSYLSFRTMDIISIILNREINVEVFKLKSENDSFDSICVFFCIKSGNLVLILQFNNDIPFKNGLEIDSSRVDLVIEEIKKAQCDSYKS